MKRTWWKEGVVYQIYPRSFRDTTGNGLGDLMGIIEKLDYIQSLGVTMVWLCPIYNSPNDDNGYDISDYRKISDDFGGDPAFDRLLEEMKKRGLKLIMDLVANHSSDEHPWFEQARKSKHNPYHDYYIWESGSSHRPPNNWQSVFSGSAWKWNAATEEYFLHLYTQKQPDLNWENPKVRAEIYAIVDYWLAKGVDGFRMDVISLISKRPTHFNVPQGMSFIDVMEKFYANGPKVHDYLKEMHREVLSKYDIVTVGEGPGVNLTHGPRYVSAQEKELDMVFHFDHLTLDFGPEGKYDPIAVDFVRFKAIFRQWDEVLATDGWNSIFLGNHDFSRIVSRFGNDTVHWEASAKLLATMLLTLRGTPYIYQGDEIGMTNVTHPHIDDYDDVETRNAWKAAEKEGKNMTHFMRAVHKQSRDNARTPMQWDNSRYGGFSHSQPWIKVNPNTAQINVQEQEQRPGSILNYYREMVEFRKNNLTLVYGKFEDLLPQHPTFYAYKRWEEKNHFLLIHNFSDNTNEYPLPLENYTLQKSNLPSQAPSFFLPWQSKIFTLRK